MNRGIILTCTLLLSTACAAMPWGRDRERDPDQVEAGLLVHVPDAERQEIHQARTDRARVHETYSIAQRDRDQVESRVELAKNDQDLLDQRVKEARDRVRQMEKLGTRDDVAEARRNLEEVRIAQRYAEAKVRYYEDLDELAGSLVDLHEKRLQLADARVELAEAEAVARLEVPAARDIDVHAFRDRVARLEDAVVMDDVEVKALRMKVDLRRDFLDERVQAVPAGFRLTEPEPVESLLTLPSPREK